MLSFYHAGEVFETFFFLKKKHGRLSWPPWNQPTLAQKKNHIWIYIVLGVIFQVGFEGVSGWRCFKGSCCEMPQSDAFQGFPLREYVNGGWWWIPHNRYLPSKSFGKCPPCSSFLAFYIYLENLVLWIYKYWSIYMYIYIYTSFSLPSSPFGLVITPHFSLAKKPKLLWLWANPHFQGQTSKVRLVFFNTAKGPFFFFRNAQTVIFAAKNT